MDTSVQNSEVKDANHGLKTLIHLCHHFVNTVDYRYPVVDQAMIKIRW